MTWFSQVLSFCYRICLETSQSRAQKKQCNKCHQEPDFIVVALPVSGMRAMRLKGQINPLFVSVWFVIQ